MLIAAYRDTGYNIVLLLHVAAVIVGLAGAIAHPLMYQLEKRRAEPDMVALAQRIAAPSRIYAIVFAIAGVIGFGLISMSDSVIEWGDAWVWLSIVVWFVATGLLHGFVVPADRAAAAGDSSAAETSANIGLVVLALVVVLLYLMILQPGG